MALPPSRDPAAGAGAALRDAASLPVDQALPALRATLQANRNTILTAPTGSGKTTRVPLALLDASFLRDRKILMLEPRRLAARAAARYMASSLGEAVGETVGYRVRLESRVSARTRVEVLTEGVLTRRLQQDPELEGVGLVVFDEFHERSLQADLGLALCLDVQQGLRDDLRLLVMSATLDAEPLVALLNGQWVQAQGRIYPVQTLYRPLPGDLRIARSLARGVLQALSETRGDVLAFLPGVAEIREAEAELSQRLAGQDVSLCPLYGDLDAAAQDRAIRPHGDGTRRVVLATAIAETSLTIEGVSVVVDSGWSRVPRFDPNNGMSRLTTVRVSRAAADQRRGRAGRLEAGVCYRLWPEQETLEAQNDAEILQADLAPLMLELALWGVDDPAALRWLDQPPTGAVAQARELLQGLDAVDDRGRITSLGRRMAALPLHPRLAHMLLGATGMAAVETAANLAALLSERDFLRRRPGTGASGDIEVRLQLLAEGCPGQGADINSGACRRILQSSRQLRALVERQGRGSRPGPVSVGMLVALAFPDRIARRRAEHGGQYLLANGRGATLAEDDPLCVHEYLAVGAMDAGGRDGRIYLAAALSPTELERLYPGHIETLDRVEWDPGRKAVRASQERRYGALVLERRPSARPDAERVRLALLQGIRREGLESLPWGGKAESLRARVQCLKEWDADGGWPDFSGPTLLAELEDWLGPWLDDAAGLADLARLDLHAALMERVGWQRAALVEELAPQSMAVPSGASRPLVYAPGEPPVLAVRLQEMFGQRETPAVCRGRVAVVLHLLSPARRPLQITRDLAGFWDRTYTEVRKEMKGRYPKHYWPEDPRNAVATAKVRPD